MLINYLADYHDDVNWFDRTTLTLTAKPVNKKSGHQFTEQECFGGKDLSLFLIKGIYIAAIQYSNSDGRFLQIHLFNNKCQKTLITQIDAEGPITHLPRILRAVIKELIVAGLSERTVNPSTLCKQALHHLLTHPELSEYLETDSFKENFDVTFSFENKILSMRFSLNFQLKSDLLSLQVGGRHPIFLTLSDRDLTHYLKKRISAH